MPQARRDLRGVRTSSEMFIALESVVARSCAASLRLEQQWTSDASEWPGPSSAARRSWMRCAGVHAVACRSAHSPRRTGRAAEQHTAQSPGHALFRVGGNLAGAAHAAVGGRAGAGAGWRWPRELYQPAAHHWRGGHECWRQRLAQRTPPQSQTRRQSGPSRSPQSDEAGQRARSAILSHHLALHRLPLPIAAAWDPRTAGQGRASRTGQGRPKRL